MATLIDVAKEAGVSPATVSRVINNSFLVSDEKKQRVYEALEKVGYVIPVKHSAPHSKNGKLLLIVLFNEHPGLCEGLQQQAGELGYSLVYQRMTEYTSEADIINLVQLLDATGQLAGIFMLDYYLGRNVDLETLFKRYPVVYIGEASQPPMTPPGICSIWAAGASPSTPPKPQRTGATLRCSASGATAPP